MDGETFRKIGNTVIHFDNLGWLSISKYRYPTNVGEFTCTDLLQQFIQSKYFLWQEEFRNNISVNINSKETTTDWNFHGLYDAKKLSLSCFEKVEFSEFRQKVLEFISHEIGETDQLDKVHNLISQLNNDGNIFYIIQDLPNDYLHEWTVFDFFMSALICNEADHTITLLEIGCN